MRLLLYGINFEPELVGIGRYSGELARFLRSRGHSVRVVASPPYYPEWKVRSGYSKYSCSRQDQDGLLIFRVPLYVPEEPTTIKRIFHLASFALLSIPALFRNLLWRPHVAICVEPTSLTAPAALLFCALTGSKSLLHIQDFEIDAMLGLDLMQDSFFSRLALRIDCWFKRRFDRVSSISSSMVAHAERRGVQGHKLLLFPNWSDSFEQPSQAEVRDFRNLWGVGQDDIVVLYSGNIGKKQGLEMMLDAAQAFLSRPHVRFFMVGAGAHAQMLRSEAKRRNLSNIQFYPLVPGEQLPVMLAAADVHLVLQRRGAADLVMPSKLSSILKAGGHALVTAEEETELGRLAMRYPGIYRCIPPEDLEAFISALDQMVTERPSCLNTVATRYAEEHLDSETILKKFERDIQALCSEG